MADLTEIELPRAKKPTAEKDLADPQAHKPKIESELPSRMPDLSEHDDAISNKSNTLARPAALAIVRMDIDDPRLTKAWIEILSPGYAFRLIDKEEPSYNEQRTLAPPPILILPLPRSERLEPKEVTSKIEHFEPDIIFLLTEMELEIHAQSKMESFPVNLDILLIL